MTEEIYAPIIDDTFTLKDALHQITRICTASNTLKKGVRQVSKSLLRKKSKLLLIDSQLDEKNKLILIALSKKMNVAVIVVECLGEIVFGKGRKCGAVVVEDFVERSEGRVFVEQMIVKGE